MNKIHFRLLIHETLDLIKLIFGQIEIFSNREVSRKVAVHQVDDEVPRAGTVVPSHLDFKHECNQSQKN